jgi:glutamyl-tRNA synthetase
MDFDAFAKRAVPEIRTVVTKDLDLNRIAEMVKTRIEVFTDIPDMVDFFQQLPDYDISLYQNKKWKVTPEKSLQVLQDLLPELEALDAWNNDALYEVLQAYCARAEVKTGFVVWPVRIAVSGRAVTPGGATEIMEVLGKEESLDRIRRGISLLEAAQ